jgi:hypothetical protein
MWLGVFTRDTVLITTRVCVFVNFIFSLYSRPGQIDNTFTEYEDATNFRKLDSV